MVYEVGDIVILKPIPGTRGNLIAKLPDGKIALWDKDALPFVKIGQHYRTVITAIKPKFVIVKLTPDQAIEEEELIR